MNKAAPVGVLLIVVAGLTGCGSSGSSSSDTSGSSASAADSSSGATSTIDACALLSDADITPLIGDHAPGKSTSSRPDVAACEWKNTDTEESVSVEINIPDTAINDTLPPLPEGITATPGPDGMRFIGSGMVEFVAAKRDCTLQVATLGPADEVNAQAVELAKKVIPQIPAS